MNSDADPQTLPPMELYTNPASPYCRKVDVVLRETGQRDAVTDIVVAGHPTDPGTLPTGVNPMGKIPVLVRDDGPALFDSVSTLSTVGLSMGLVGADMPTDLKLTLALGMWLGRLEFIPGLLLAPPMPWRTRRT